MLRRLHSFAGLALALMLVVIAATGVGLSVQPAADRLSIPAISPGVSVAALAGAVAARHQRVDAIRVRGDGGVTVSYNDGAGKQVEIVDPRTGAGLGAYRQSATFRWLADAHRSLLMGDTGRIAVAIAALGLLVLSVTGTAMLARSLGGVGALLRPIPTVGISGAARRWHGELGRLALTGLLVSSLTGVFLSATTFGLFPNAANPAPAVAASGGPAAPVGGLAALAAVDIADLERLVFPARNDATDVFTLRSRMGEALVDTSTGAVLEFAPMSAMDRIGRWANALHTGRISWVFAIFLGLSTAAAPVMGVTGFLLWRRRATQTVIKPASTPSEDADTIILVGSEGGSTWGFAHTLSRGLTEAGHRVGLAAMNDIEGSHLRAQRLVILAATYGDGGAPASARRFLDRLDNLERRIPVAVLGFGDRTFPNFCGYAEHIVAALDARGWPRLTAPKRIDRRSAQEFAQWGRDLGAALGCTLTLEHVAERPKTSAFQLVGRVNYGEAVGAPVAILRFAARRLPRFEAGDLVGIVAPGSDMPRFYSLASAQRDGVLEICVRLQPGGLCSTWLHGLKEGEGIEAFIRENPSFRPVEGRSPLILIGAGAGIAPLAGFVRANDARRQVHLYWGGRSASSDFLYENQLAESLAQRRLTTLRTAFSRHAADAAYVQDRVADDAHRLRDLIRAEAQILVCGGREMARAVTEALDVVVRPLGLDLATLKSNGRYLEDVY
jgi:sulfite reductase (NADPH) flavoprotein alpha-component